METPEILPAPVYTMEALYAKLDTILAVAEGWDSTAEGDDLDELIIVRVHELYQDIERIHGTDEEWRVFGEKCEAIRSAVSANLTKALNAVYEAS